LKISESVSRRFVDNFGILRHKDRAITKTLSSLDPALLWEVFGIKLLSVFPAIDLRSAQQFLIASVTQTNAKELLTSLIQIEHQTVIFVLQSILATLYESPSEV
jgi:hypothetical protein